MSTKKKKTNIASYVIILLSAVILVGYVFFVDGFPALYDVVVHARLHWLLAGLCLLIIYWVLEASILHIAAKRLYKPQRFISTLKTTIIGQYFNCITPSASGGQPMQAYHMHNCGMPVGSAVSALLIRFVVYQVLLTVYCIVILFFGSTWIAGKLWLVLIGFAVNTVVVVALLGLSFAPGTIRGIGKFFVKLLYKIRILKDREKYDEYIDLEVEKFCKNMRRSVFGWKILAKMSVITVVQLTAYFLIPFCVFSALGYTLNPLLVICASAFVLMVTSFVPLPGAAGGAEGGFLIYFGILLGQDIDKVGATAVLLWRVITFYFPIVVGAFFTRNISKKTIDTVPILSEDDG